MNLIHYLEFTENGKTSFLANNVEYSIPSVAQTSGILILLAELPSSPMRFVLRHSLNFLNKFLYKPTFTFIPSNSSYQSIGLVHAFV